MDDFYILKHVHAEEYTRRINEYFAVSSFMNVNKKIYIYVQQNEKKVKTQWLSYLLYDIHSVRLVKENSC